MSYNNQMINLEQQTPVEVSHALAKRMRTLRRTKKITQLNLSLKAGVSLASLKRFEQKGEISLASLIRLSFALGCESDFDALFTRKGYASIQEVIDEKR